MAGDPVTAGLSLADKLFSFFTGEKFDEIRKRRAGDQLQAKANEALKAWRLYPTSEKWKAYKDAEKNLVDWSNSP